MNTFATIWKRYGKFEYLLLFLMSIELFGMHHFVLLFLFLCLCFKERIGSQFYVFDFGILLLWGGMYWLFIDGSHLWSNLQVPSWLAAFLVGSTLCKDKRSFFDVLLIIAIGYAVEGLLTVTLSEGMNAMIAWDNDVASVDRKVDSFWGNGITRSFSALNVSYYLYSGLLVYILFRKEEPFWNKSLALIFGFSFILISLRIAMRSSLLFNPLIFAISYFGLLSKKTGRGGRTSAFFLICLIFVLLYFSGLFEKLTDSYLFYRIDTQEDGGFAHNSRFALQASFWTVWDQYPWGDLHDHVGHYFHNTWMDIYAFSGIISAALFLILTIRFLFNAFYIFKRTDGFERSLILGILAAFYLPFYMDPMFQAAPAFMAFYVLVFGMLSKRRYMISHTTER